MIRCTGLAALAVMAASGALSAQTVAIGAGAAVLTTPQTLQGQPGGGVLGVTAQVEAVFARAGARADLTVYDGAVFATLGASWHFRGPGRPIDPFVYAGGALQLPTFDHGDGPGGGVLGGIGASLRPARSPAGLTVDLRLYHLFRNAYEFDPRTLVQISVGFRLALS